MTAPWHGRACIEDPCDFCQHKAEDRKAARDEPLSEWEEGRLDDWAQREMERTWP